MFTAYILGADAHIRPLEQGSYPINQAVDHGCGHAVDDDRAGDSEHFCADA